MTRAEIHRLYHVDSHGIIRSPGRFEGEPWWIVEVNEWTLDGDGEILQEMETDGIFSVLLDVTAEDRELFGLNADTCLLRFTQDHNGFCYVQEVHP